jgi:hypothetical protein
MRKAILMLCMALMVVVVVITVQHIQEQKKRSVQKDQRVVDLAGNAAQRSGLSLQNLSPQVERSAGVIVVRFLPPPTQLGEGFEVRITPDTEQVVGILRYQ